MDPKNFVPSFLNESRFSGQAFTLTDFSATPGNIMQTFRGKNIYVVITYTDDGSMTAAELVADSVLGDLENNEYYGPFVQFRPSILDSPEYNKQQWALQHMHHDMLKGLFRQNWVSGGYIITVNFDDTFNIQIIQVLEDWLQKECRRYYDNGNLKKHDQRINAYVHNTKKYYENGNLEYDMNETLQGVPVGKSKYYTQEGVLSAEHDFERSPFHYIGYEKVMEIAKEQGLSGTISPMLRWSILDHPAALLHIDAIKGYANIEKRPDAVEQPGGDKPAYCNLSFEDLLTDHLGKENILVIDGEEFASGDDYKKFLDDMIKLSNGILELQDISIVDGETRLVSVTINNASRDFTIMGHTDWLDNRFIIQINFLLDTIGSKYLFYLFNDVRYGQEAGLIFIRRTMADYFVFLSRKCDDHINWGGLYDPFKENEAL